MDNKENNLQIRQNWRAQIVEAQISTILNQQPPLIMQYLIVVILALILTSCEGLNVNFQGDKGGYSYTSKGGLVITPKAIQLIEPAK